MSDRSQARPWWLWPNLLSLDAPAVALVWLWAFADQVEVSPGWNVYLLLGLAVWCIYAFDRVMDGWKMKREEQAARHRFGAEHSRVLLVFVIKGVVAGFIVAWFTLPPGVFWTGTVLAGLVGLYFWQLQTRLFVPKEVACGLLFSGGVLCGLYERGMGEMLSEGAIFALLCVSNCFVISKWESPTFRRSRELVFLMGIVIASGMAIAFDAFATGVSLAMAGGLLLGLDRLRTRIPVKALRVLADAVLLTPLLVIPVSRLFE